DHIEYTRTTPRVVALLGDTLLDGCENLSQDIHTATRSGEWRRDKKTSVTKSKSFPQNFPQLWKTQHYLPAVFPVLCCPKRLSIRLISCLGAVLFFCGFC